MSVARVRLSCGHIVTTVGDRSQPILMGEMRWCGECAQRRSIVGRLPLHGSQPAPFSHRAPDLTPEQRAVIDSTPLGEPTWQQRADPSASGSSAPTSNAREERP